MGGDGFVHYSLPVRASVLQVVWPRLVQPEQYSSLAVFASQCVMRRCAA
jgi:hypothetical protein